MSHRAPVIVVHGGAGGHNAGADSFAYIEAVEAALDHGAAALKDGARAAVLAAVTYMEKDTILNAGRGATLDAEGNVALDAGFMDGASRRFGAVGGVTRTPTPILLAERLSGDGEFGRFLAGAAANARLEDYGIERCEPADLVTRRARRAWAERTSERRARPADTVGAVALDAAGNLAAAVSTGGVSFKPAGRIGDSCVVGAGFWAENGRGACVTSGVGEAMLREGTARRAVRLIGNSMSTTNACLQALGELADERSRPPCGLILLSSEGELAIAHSSEEMPAGYARVGTPPVVHGRW